MAAENGEMTALLRKLIGSLEQQNEQKDELIRQKDEQIAHLEEQIAQLNQTVANLNETVLEFQRKLFGTSSEKTPADAFNEAEAEQDPSKEDPPAGIVVGGYTRARRTKKKKATYEELMSGLPVEELRCYVAEEDRVCDWCGHEMVHAGWKKVREEIQIIPAQVKRILVMQEVVECTRLQARQGVPENCPHAISTHTAQLRDGFYGSVCHVYEICHVRAPLPPGNGLERERRHLGPDNNGELGDILRDELHETAL